MGEIFAHIHSHGVAEFFEFIGERVHDGSFADLLIFPENELLPYSRNRYLSSTGKGPFRIAFRQSFKKNRKNRGFLRKNHEKEGERALKKFIRYHIVQAGEVQKRRKNLEY